jgi:probable phosphoglycerate mutase
MMRLILVRHGETVGNAEDRCQGQHDTPLNDTGRQQVARVAARLAAESFDVVYASDLSRAWETATAILDAHDGIPLHPEPRLREQSKGVWDGLRWDDIRAQRAEEFAAWQADRDAAPPGGETLSQTVARIRAFLDDLTRDHPGQTVLIAAHGAVLRTLICLALGIDPAFTWHFHLDNTGLSELRRYPEGWVLHRLNDTGHL